MPKNNVGHDLPTNRGTWKSLASPSSFFPNFPEWYRIKLDNCMPKFYEREWLVCLAVSDGLLGSPLGYINEDGTLTVVGCYYCLDTDSYRLDGKILWVGGKEAPPLNKFVDAFSLPPEIQQFQLNDMNIFICPYCKSVIRKYSDISQDPTTSMTASQRRYFLETIGSGYGKRDDS